MIFLEHLKQWSKGHDSSSYFQGSMSLLPLDLNKKEIALGRSVTCILTDKSFVDARKIIVIRLFAPQMDTRSKVRSARQDAKSDIMDLYSTRMKLTEHEKHDSTDVEDEDLWQPSPLNPNTPDIYYKLVIRCGSGWLSAREYLNNLYFRHKRILKPSPGTFTPPDRPLALRSQVLSPPPFKKDTVTIQPLFHPFLRLPPELQEIILLTAAGLSKHFNLCPDRHTHYTPISKPPISLSTMLRISKPITAVLAPYIYRSTTFHLGTTGLTSFLWSLGPVHRPQIRRLSLHFGRLSLLHCIRWLAPDQVYEVLEQPHITNPSSLAHFWRCQLQELAKHVRLHTLTIDLRGVERADIGFIVKILRGVFGDVKFVRFIETDGLGRSTKVGEGDVRLKDVGEKSWRELCRACFVRHKQQYGFFSKECMQKGEQELDAGMDKEGEFFDG
jgi:hypothetical protein